MENLISREATIEVIEEELEKEREQLTGGREWICTIGVLETVLEKIKNLPVSPS